MADVTPSTPGSASPKAAPWLHLGHPESHLPWVETPATPSAAQRQRTILIGAASAAALAFLGQYFEHMGGQAAVPVVSLGWVLPFALLLGCIAGMPFIARHFWERYFGHVAVGLGGIVTAYYLLIHGGGAMAKSMGEYISFIYLLGSLFILSGGILIRVRRKATPGVNTMLLLAGALLANIFGTTGAAMLLIRPYLRINKGHIRPYHIVFFIFIVANVGGSLTPIGDPPLFLGYLKGVPFWWVAEKCWPMWGVAVGVLLAVFLVMDTLAQRKVARAEHGAEDLGPTVSVFGAGNLLLVLAVLAGILLHERLAHVLAIPWRELIMVAAVSISLWTTPQRIHVENVFNFAPIREVAILFLGIFATMVPALNYLAVHAADPDFHHVLGTPGQFYYTSGTLSAVLDNAPTYLTFLETELAKLPPEALMQDGRRTSDEYRVRFLLMHPQLEWYLIGISLGAVFFGAMTYIGNGPNFMVKSIAEHAGAPCPSFFGYIFCYALPVLLPVLILIWGIFLYAHAGV